MSDEMQALFMQARIVRLASASWGLSLRKTVSLFREHGVLEYVRDCFDYFHMESDIAVFDDVCKYLSARGVDVHVAA